MRATIRAGLLVVSVTLVRLSLPMIVWFVARANGPIWSWLAGPSTTAPSPSAPSVPAAPVATISRIRPSLVTVAVGIGGGSAVDTIGAAQIASETPKAAVSMVFALRRIAAPLLLPQLRHC